MENKIEIKNTMRNYKGFEIEIGSLTGQVCIPIQAISLEIPKYRTINSNYEYGGEKFPKLAVITNVGPSIRGNGIREVIYSTYVNGFMTHRVAIPTNFKVKQLTGGMAEKMVNKYNEFQIMNLNNNVNWNGGAIGSDPEIFVEDENGAVIPAFSFLESKTGPNRAKTFQGMSVYWDGFQAEFETRAEACLAYQVDSVQYGLSELYKQAKRKFPKAKLSAQTVMEIPYDVLQNSAEEHVSFGCMPSKNVYGLEGLKTSGRDLAFRSAGGHIHLGVGKQTEEKTVNIVKSLDAILGVSCVSLFAKFDNPVRRQYYGLPGEYRTPAHGIEYRTLSNAWMFHPFLMNIVFDLSRKATMFGMNGLLKYWKGSEPETIEVIKNCDVDKAREIMDRNKDVLTQLIQASYSGYGKETGKNVFKIFRNGMETVIKEPANIVKNWDLEGRWQTHSDGPGKNVKYGLSTIMKGGMV